jgi:cyclopropane fatty-acyl-phospholipid synthase-like methyltransferase
MKGLVLLILLLGSAHAVTIDERGFWVGNDADIRHTYDTGMGYALVKFFKNEQAASVVDLGCGMGDYVRTLLDHQISAAGYDGNPDTPELSKGLCGVFDLSAPADLGKRYDWVVSLEVAEHIPKEYETHFVENLDRHNRKGIVLSWALVGQGGFGHFNCQNNDYVKDLLAQYGYINDLEAEEVIRSEVHFTWFRDTLMVFRRKQILE